MSALKTKLYNWRTNEKRELTLLEFLGQLPSEHLARTEAAALKQEVERLQTERDVLYGSALCHMEQSKINAMLNLKNPTARHNQIGRRGDSTS